MPSIGSDEKVYSENESKSPKHEYQIGSVASFGCAIPKTAVGNCLRSCLLITQGSIALGATAGIPADPALPTAARTLNKLDVLAAFFLLENLFQDHQEDQDTKNKASSN
jgi:hypothetical protein